MIHARTDYDRIQDPAGLIPDDEPVMLIRGQDQAAIPAMQAWIKAHYAGGGTSELPVLISEQIERVRIWQASRACKVADL